MTPTLAQQLENLQQSCCLIPDFLTDEEIAAVNREISLWLQEKRFRPAGIGRQSQYQVESSIRGDLICWFDDSQPSPVQQMLADKLENLRVLLNRQYFLSLNQIETHYAVYPPGTGYQRHFDNFQHSRRRLVTAVIYLNAGWQEPDGGQLRLYLPETAGNQTLDIWPEAGNLALFFTTEVEHEVLPARRERRSITSWFGHNQALL